jgi:hypothetical protein
MATERQVYFYLFYGNYRIVHLVRCDVACTSKSTNCTGGAVDTLVAKGSPSTKTPKKLPIKENNQPSRVRTKLR